MDLQQVWRDAINAVKATIQDPQDQAIIGLLEFQVSINIIGNDIHFLCSSEFIFNIAPKFVPKLYMEIVRLVGNPSLGFKLEAPMDSNASKHSQMYNAQDNAASGSNIQMSFTNESLNNGFVQQHVSPVKKVNRSFSGDHINPDKTFENYVTDPENSLVFAIAQKIASNPGSEAYNPFYVYGGSGLGKTHLLWAIANRIRATLPNKSVVYIRAEEFIRRFVDYLQTKNSDPEQVKFQENFTKHDVFIIDDIQSLTKAEKSRDAFFEIIADFLDKQGSQLILASDVAPSNLKNFNPRIVSRFGSGLCREIYPPSPETRAAITLKKCSELGITLPQSIVDYIANNIRSSVREIEGAIKTLKSHIDLKGSMITYDDAVKSLANLVNSNRQVTSIDAIKERVAKEYGVTVSSMESAERKKATSLARSMAMTLAADLIPTLSLNDIGRSFNKDHSSVHEAIKRTREKIAVETDDQSAIYQKLTLSLKKD